MDSKHTPGPWGIHPFKTELNAAINEDGRAFAYATTRIGSGNTIIAEVCMCSADAGYPSVKNLHEMEANALLIAAAPDMLSELIRVRDMLIACGFADDEIERMDAVIQAAIEGKS